MLSVSLVQSHAIVEYLAETLGRFASPAPSQRQVIREWLNWDADVLWPPIFNCYGVRLGQMKLLPIAVDPVIADYHRRRAAYALDVLESRLDGKTYLCGKEPTIADITCYGDVAFAEICEVDLTELPWVADWAGRIRALPGFQAPFGLLEMKDAEITVPAPSGSRQQI